MRVIPDISLDADPSTGFLIGLHEISRTARSYGQTRYGGTSLASPLLAGVIADADQASIAAGGAAVGFINPAIYRLDTTPGRSTTSCPAAVRPSTGWTTASPRSGSQGVVNSFRELTYTGQHVTATKPATVRRGRTPQYGHGLRQHDRARHDRTQLHHRSGRHLTDRGAEPPDSAWRQAGTRGCPPGALVVFLDRNMLG